MNGLQKTYGIMLISAFILIIYFGTVNGASVADMGKQMGVSLGIIGALYLGQSSPKKSDNRDYIPPVNQEKKVEENKN